VRSSSGNGTALPPSRSIISCEAIETLTSSTPVPAGREFEAPLRHARIM
jgi:hypothetical protein